MSLSTVSDPLSEAGKVAFEGDTNCAEACVEIPRRAIVMKAAMLLATIDVAIVYQRGKGRKQKERKGKYKGCPLLRELTCPDCVNEVVGGWQSLVRLESE